MVVYIYYINIIIYVIFKKTLIIFNIKIIYMNKYHVKFKMVLLLMIVINYYNNYNYKIKYWNK
jgi:hypothetical protein